MAPTPNVRHRVAGAQSARRQSLAKLNNLPLEAPITKVISLITKAQENSNENVSQVLDKVSTSIKVLASDVARTYQPITSKGLL